MNKTDLNNKLAAFGVKIKGPATVAELRKMLSAAETDGSKPGHNIARGPQPGDHN